MNTDSKPFFCSLDYNPNQLGWEPANFDAIEIHGVRDATPSHLRHLGSCCEMDDEHPEFYSVYLHFRVGHPTEGGVDCVGDFTRHADAVAYAELLAESYGWPITHIVTNGGNPVSHPA